jgi:hypothetical protein
MQQSPGIVEQFQAMAEGLWSQFVGGRNCRLRQTGVVHAVAPVSLLGDLVVPGARCHTGVPGGELGAITPTREVVSCRSCIEILRARGELDGPGGERQLALFALPEGGDYSPAEVDGDVIVVPSVDIDSVG